METQANIPSNNSIKWIHVLLRGSCDTHKTVKQCDTILRDEYVDQFVKISQTAITVPILKFQFKDIDQLANTIRDLPENAANGMIIVSPRVVEALERAFGLFDEETRFDLCGKFDSELIFVVGSKSAKECEARLDLRYNRQSAECGDGAELTKFIKTYLNNNSRRPINLIYPRGTRSENNIEESIAEEIDVNVLSEVVYETSGIDDVHQIIMDRLIHSLPQKLDFTKLVINLIFFSPSGVESFEKVKESELANMIKAIVPKCEVQFRYSSIGRTTEKALLNKGLDVFCVSARPSANSLVESISDLILEDNR